MLPTAHAFITLILWWFLKSFFNVNDFYLIPMIIFGVMIDADVIYDKMHRGLITHTFTFWIPICFLLALYSPLLGFIAFLSVTVHLLMDMIDYKIRPFYPILDKWVGLGLVNKYHERRDTLLGNLLLNLKTPPVLVIELIIDIIGFLVFIVSFETILSIIMNFLSFLFSAILIR